MDYKIPSGPNALNGVRQISFKVINSTHKKYGQPSAGTTVANAMDNITVSGDALLLSAKSLTDLNTTNPGIVSFNFTSGTWTVNLIPIMDTSANGGGKITINAKWKGSGGQAAACHTALKAGCDGVPTGRGEPGPTDAFVSSQRDHGRS